MNNFMIQFVGKYYGLNINYNHETDMFECNVLGEKVQGSNKQACIDMINSALDNEE